MIGAFRAAAVTMLCVVAAAPVGAQTRPVARTVASLEDVDGSLRFLIVGDWGRHNEPGQARVAKQLRIAAERLDADFVISTGDNFYPNGVQSVQDPNWRTSFEEPYGAHPLQIDWWVVLGNHDYHGDPEAEIAYSKISRRWHMPARYFAREFSVDDSTRALFAFVDTSPFIQAYREEPDDYAVAGQDTVAQLRWLDSTLAASNARWKFVVGHHHIYSGGKRSTQAELERLLVPIMARHGVQAYISGHEHDLQHIVRPNGKIQYFVSGAGAERRPTGKTDGTRFAASSLGFMTGTLTHGGLDIRAFDDNGKELHRAVVPAH